MNRRIIKMEHTDATAKIFGSFDCHAHRIEKQFSVTLRNRESDAGDSIVIEGEDESAVNSAAECVSYLHELSGKTEVITEQSLQYALDMISAGQTQELASLGDSCICLTTRGKPVKAKTVGQQQYIESIKKNTNW